MAKLMKVRISFHTCTCVLLILLSVIQCSCTEAPKVQTTETSQPVNNTNATSPGTSTATSNPPTQTKTTATSLSTNGNTNSNKITDSSGDNSTVAQTVTSVTPKTNISSTSAPETNKTNLTKPATTASTLTTLATTKANSAITDKPKVTTTVIPLTVSGVTTTVSGVATISTASQGTTSTHSDTVTNNTSPAPVNPTNGTGTPVDTTNGTTTPVGITAPNVTRGPAVTTTQTTVKSTSTQSVTTVGVNTEGSSGKPSSASTANPSPISPSRPVVYINEIMVDKQGIFQKIEIRIPNPVDLSRYAIVMVDGSTSKTLSVIYLGNFTLANNGEFLDVPFNSTSTLPDKGIGIAIYDTTMIEQFTDDWIVTNTGVVDALVIGKTYDGVSVNIVNILTPGVDPFVLDPSKYGIERSISRCSADSVRSTEMFAYINPSMGENNDQECRNMKDFQNTLSIKMSMQCGDLKLDNNTVNERLLHKVIKSLVKDINKKCQCGITRMHVLDPHIQCCEWTNVDMKFVAPNKTQVDAFLHSFRAFIDQTTQFNVSGKSYNLDQSCLNDCCAPVVTPLSKKDNSKNVKVTVAVIVTLLVLFLIIVFVIYMYMRRKKMAVQQFRMSRLEEDEEDYEDMTVGMTADDHDEFVGGQEATFDLKA